MAVVQSGGSWGLNAEPYPSAIASVPLRDDLRVRPVNSSSGHRQGHLEPIVNQVLLGQVLSLRRQVTEPLTYYH